MSLGKVDINQKWLNLLLEAISEGEDIRANHRYKYKNHNVNDSKIMYWSKQLCIRSIKFN